MQSPYPILTSFLPLFFTSHNQTSFSASGVKSTVSPPCICWSSLLRCRLNMRTDVATVPRVNGFFFCVTFSKNSCTLPHCANSVNEELYPGLFGQNSPKYIFPSRLLIKIDASQ